MLSGMRRFPSLFLVAVSAVVFTSALDARAAAPNGAAASTLTIDGLGKGTAPIDGPWQFHLGDNAAWADPALDDSGWEQLTADKTLGRSKPSQLHGVCVVPAIDSDYNGSRRAGGRSSADSGHRRWIRALLERREGRAAGDFAAAYGALRGSTAADFWPGPGEERACWRFAYGRMRWPRTIRATWVDLKGVPLIGSPDAIAAVKGAMDFRWLRGQQFAFGLTSLYALVALLSFIAWLRDRNQWVLFWMSIFASDAHAGSAARWASPSLSPMRSRSSSPRSRSPCARLRGGFCLSGCCNCTIKQSWFALRAPRQ